MSQDRMFASEAIERGYELYAENAVAEQSEDEIRERAIATLVTLCRQFMQLALLFPGFTKEEQAEEVGNNNAHLRHMTVLKTFRCIAHNYRLILIIDGKRTGWYTAIDRTVYSHNPWYGSISNYPVISQSSHRMDESGGWPTDQVISAIEAVTESINHYVPKWETKIAEQRTERNKRLTTLALAQYGANRTIETIDKIKESAE